MKQLNGVKRLLDSHIKIGMAIAPIFYLALFFGSWSMLAPYLAIWEKPSRHIVPASKPINLNSLVLPKIIEGDWPSSGIKITLPNDKEPAIGINHRFVASEYLHPHSGMRLADEGPGLSRFIVDLHLGRVLGRPGIFIMGMACIGAVFLIFNGWWLCFKRKSNSVPLLRWHPGSWTRWHRRLSQWLTLLTLVLALSSAFLGSMFTLGSGFAYGISNGRTTSTRAILGPVVFPPQTPAVASEIKSAANLNQLFDRAKQDYPELNITEITLDHWGDRNATATFSGPLKMKPYLTERINRLSVTYRARDGLMLFKQTLGDVHWVKMALSALYFLHFMTDLPMSIRVLSFLFGIGICLSVVTGVMVWCFKYQRRSGMSFTTYLGLRGLITIFLGVIPATAVAMLLQWGLPFELLERAIWVRGGFYLTWLTGLAWTIGQQDIHKAVANLIVAGGLTLCIVPIVHGLSSGFWFWDCLLHEMTAIAVVDGLILLFGLLLLLCRLFIVNRPFKV